MLLPRPHCVSDGDKIVATIPKRQRYATEFKIDGHAPFTVLIDMCFRSLPLYYRSQWQDRRALRDRGYRERMAIDNLLAARRNLKPLRHALSGVT